MQLHYCRNLKISINTVNAKSTVGYLGTVVKRIKLYKELIANVI